MLGKPTPQEYEILNQYYERNKDQIAAVEIDPTLRDITAVILLDDGTLVGSMSLYNIRPGDTAEFGVSIFDPRGIFKVIPDSIEFLGRSFDLPLQKIYCRIHKSNVKALTTAINGGFFIEDNSDVVTLSMTREQFEKRCIELCNKRPNNQEQ